MALTNCGECGKQVSDRAVSCPNCGAPIAAQSMATAVTIKAPKSRSMAVVLAILLGSLGLHHFYLNRPGLGVLYIIFCWTFIPAILGFLEGICYLMTSEKVFQQKYGQGVDMLGMSVNQTVSIPVPKTSIITWLGLGILVFIILLSVINFLSIK